MVATTEELVRRLRNAFAHDLERPPQMTLREADAVDSFGTVPLPHPAEDPPSAGYLNRYAWGITHLDAASWRHYLPALGELAIQSLSQQSLAVSCLIESLRPPDRDPPRLRSLVADQECVLRELLELLASSGQSIWQREACQALEEWWIDGALYR